MESEGKQRERLERAIRIILSPDWNKSEDTKTMTERTIFDWLGDISPEERIAYEGTIWGDSFSGTMTPGEWQSMIENAEFIGNPVLRGAAESEEGYFIRSGNLWYRFGAPLPGEETVLAIAPF